MRLKPSPSRQTKRPEQPVLWKPGSEPAFPLDWGGLHLFQDSFSSHWSIVRLTLVWVRRHVCLQETCVLHYSLATQMLKRTKKGSSPHHSVRLECVCQKNCRSKVLEEPRHCLYGLGGGLAISLTSYPNSKEESVPLQMVAQVHCWFLMSIPFIFLYYFSYFDQSCNQIHTKKNSLFCLSIWGYKYPVLGGCGGGNMSWLVTLCPQSEAEGWMLVLKPFLSVPTHSVQDPCPWEDVIHVQEGCPSPVTLPWKPIILNSPFAGFQT